jgi:hypothetical protein
MEKEMLETNKWVTMPASCYDFIAFWSMLAATAIFGDSASLSNDKVKYLVWVAKYCCMINNLYYEISIKYASTCIAFFSLVLSLLLNMQEVQ